MEQLNFKKVSLSAAKLPILIDGEVVIRSESNVSVEKTDKTHLVSSAIVMLTNISLYIVPMEGGNLGLSLSLAVINIVQDCPTYFMSSNKLKIIILPNETIYIRFGSGGKDDFFSSFQQSLQRKSWLHILSKEKDSMPENMIETENKLIPTRKVGIAGIVERQKISHKNVEALTKSSLDDIDSLMQRAREVVSIIQRYSSILQKSHEEKELNDLSPSSSEIGDTVEMESIIHSIGIISPVTKFSAGRLYHEQLARQITDVLLSKNLLQRLGGLITLTDVYCIYNRARGNELISPDDLLESCKIMQTLSIGIHLRTFNSGVLALQLDSLDENTLCSSLLTVIESHAVQGIHATFVSQYFKISITIAKEILLLAENRGDLCRDESMNGLFFFPNLFNEL